MSFISRQRWRISIASVITLLALMLSLGYAVASRGQSHAAEPLTQISSDPYTNITSNHKTQVEPDTFAFGKTIVATFQSGRFFDGGASNIGFATSTNAGETWTHGFLRLARSTPHRRASIFVPVTPRWPTMPSTRSGSSPGWALRIRPPVRSMCSSVARPMGDIPLAPLW